MSGAGAGAALLCYWGCYVGVLLGLLFSGVGDGWQGARAGAVWGIVVVASS